MGSQKRAGWLVAGVLALAASLLPSAAVAAFPGENGRIAYSDAPLGEVPHIFTSRPDGSDPQQLTDDPNTADNQPSWSADGRRLAFVGDNTLFAMDADGGALTRLADAGYPLAAPSFSPSGARIVYAPAGSIRTIRPDGTDPRRLLRGSLADPEYSPNGKRIVFAGEPGGKHKAGIWTIRRDGSHLRRLTKGGSDAEPDYSPDGQHIAFTRYVAQQRIRVMRRDGSRQHGVPNTELATGPAFAPAGDRIVVAIFSLPPNLGGCSDLYTISPSGSDKQRVTQNCDQSDIGGQATAPTWQPLPAN